MPLQAGRSKSGPEPQEQVVQEHSPISAASGGRFWSNSPEAVLSVAPGWVPTGSLVSERPQQREDIPGKRSSLHWSLTRHPTQDPGTSWERHHPHWIHALPGGDTPGSLGATSLEKPPDAPESAPADGRGSAPHLGSPDAPRGTTARRQPPPGSDTSSRPHRGPCLMQGGAPPAAPSSGRNTQKPGDRSGKTKGPRAHQLGGDEVSRRRAQAEGAARAAD